MSGLRQLKCECGQTVSAGSVFCPSCRAEIQKMNDRVIEKEEMKYQKKMKGLGQQRH